MKLSEKLKRYHESGDFGRALDSVWQKAKSLEQQLSDTQARLEEAETLIKEAEFIVIEDRHGYEATYCGISKEDVEEFLANTNKEEGE